MEIEINVKILPNSRIIPNNSIAILCNTIYFVILLHYFGIATFSNIVISITKYQSIALITAKYQSITISTVNTYCFEFKYCRKYC